MHHDVVLSGWGCRLRPVTVADAGFIVRVRSQDRAKGNIHVTNVSIADQEAWIRNYLERDNEYYWIIEDMYGSPFGTAGLYNYNADVLEAEGGRWVMFPKFPFSVAAPDLLLKKWVFEGLKLKRLIFHVVATNRKVLHFHELMGARKTFLQEKAVQIDNQQVDVQWFEITREMWPLIFERWNAIL